MFKSLALAKKFSPSLLVVLFLVTFFFFIFFLSRSTTFKPFLGPSQSPLVREGSLLVDRILQAVRRGYAAPADLFLEGAGLYVVEADRTLAALPASQFGEELLVRGDQVVVIGKGTSPPTSVSCYSYSAFHKSH